MKVDMDYARVCVEIFLKNMRIFLLIRMRLNYDGIDLLPALKNKNSFKGKIFDAIDGEKLHF